MFLEVKGTFKFFNVERYLIVKHAMYLKTIVVSNGSIKLFVVFIMLISIINETWCVTYKLNKYLGIVFTHNIHNCNIIGLILY